MGAGFDGSIKIDTSINAKGFNSGISSMMGRLKQVGAAMTAAFGSVFALVGGAMVLNTAFNFGKSAVEEANKLATAMTGLQYILANQGRSFQDAKSLIEAYTADGLVPATNAINAYKNLALAGFSNTQIEDMLKRIKDAAAFGKAEHLSLGEAIQTATEGIRQENSILVDNAGITKNLARMWDEYAKSIGKTANNLTQAEKNQATYNGIMQETEALIGAAGKYTEAYGGKVMGISAAFKNLKTAIGDSIIPVLSAIIPTIRAVVDQLTALFRAVAQFSRTFFNAGPMDTVAGYQAETQAAADAQGDLADEMERTNKAAKGALASFDDLNVLQKDQDQAPGSVPVQVVPPSTGEVENQLSPLEEAIASFAVRVRTYMQDLFAPLQGPLSRLKEAMSGLGEQIREALGWAWENILKPLGEWLMREVAPRFINLLSTGLEVLGVVLDRIKPYLLWFWDNFLKPVAQWTGRAILDFLDWLQGGLERLRDLLASGQPFDPLLESLRYLADTLLPWFKEQWGNLKDWFSAAVIQPMALFFVNLWRRITDSASQAWQNIKLVWALLGLWFQQNVINPVRDAFGGVLDWLRGAWENTFTGIRNFVRNTINSIIDFINGMISAVAGGINAVLNGINSIRVTIPDWVPVFGGSSWGLNIPMVPVPQIPRLATGAVIPPNREFAAILGDQRSGTNIEAPADLIRQIVGEEMDRRGTDGISVRFEGTMATLIQALQPEIRRDNRRRGTSLITGDAPA